MVAFWQLLLSLRIHAPCHSRVQSHFRIFRSLLAFDGRILAAFAHCRHSTVAFWRLFLSPHSPTPPLPPRSRVRSHFCRFRTLSAFDGRILAGFAQSQHSTVAFWQLFLSPHSHTPPLPPVLAYDRIFATFTNSQYSTVAFWQLLLNLSIRR